jgi:Tol biopolymer transport system component
VAVFAVFQPDLFLLFAQRIFAPQTIVSTATITTTATQTIEASPALASETIPAVTEKPTTTATLILTSTATATLTNTPVPSTTPLGGSYGQIAFASDRSSSMQIWLMDSSGKNLRQLTNRSDGACEPAFSPDGNKLAFISPCTRRADSYPGANIYTMNIDGSNVQKMPESSPAGDYDPAWSSDAQMLAFTSLRSGKEHVFVLNLNNSSIEELSSENYPERNPYWDPSNKNLAITRVTTSSQIWILPTNGQAPWQFSRSGDFDNSNPQWSNDGTFMVYTQMKTGGGMPALVQRMYEDRDNSKETRIPQPAADQTVIPIMRARLSPDGMWYVFESWPDGNNHDIYVMDKDGKNRVRLTKDPAIDIQPVWRPGSIKP